MKNQLKIGVILSYVYMGINMLIQLIYTPVMIHLLGQSEYGLYNLVGSVVSYLSLFSLGFSGAYLRFYTRAEKNNIKENKDRINGMFVTIFMIMGFVALITGIILTQFTPQIFGEKLSKDEIDTAKMLMYVLVINISLTFPSTIFDSIITAYEKFIFQKIVSLIGVIFNPLICLPLLIMGYGSVALVIVITIITTLKLLVNIVYCIYILKVRFKFDGFNIDILKEMAVFSSFIFINMIIDQINWNVDKFIIGRVKGTEQVAVYGVGSQINSLIISMSTAVSSVFAPRVNRIANDNKKNVNKKFTHLFIKVGRIQFIILGLVISGFCFFGRYFICNLYAGKEYSDSYIIALLLVLPGLIPLIQNMGIEIQRSVNKHKARAGVYFIMALINVGISIPLTMNLGGIGSALGTCISIIFANGLFMNVYYMKALNIGILEFWKNILQILKGMSFPIIYGILFCIFIEVISNSVFFIGILLYTIIYIFFVYQFSMNESEKNIMKSMFFKLKGALYNGSNKR